MHLFVPTASTCWPTRPILTLLLNRLYSSTCRSCLFFTPKKKESHNLSHQYNDKCAHFTFQFFMVVYNATTEISCPKFSKFGWKFVNLQQVLFSNCMFATMTSVTRETCAKAKCPPMTPELWNSCQCQAWPGHWTGWLAAIFCKSNLDCVKESHSGFYNSILCKCAGSWKYTETVQT